MIVVMHRDEHGRQSETQYNTCAEALAYVNQQVEQGYQCKAPALLEAVLATGRVVLVAHDGRRGWWAYGRKERV